jgi:aspartyl-tRNA(Asn)/glutamyl-tRNA(Gln) amidotransferase subunit A
MLGSFLDWCGLSIPNGTDQNGMPTGFLFSAPHGRDSDILSTGLALEAVIRN